MGPRGRHSKGLAVTTGPDRPRWWYAFRGGSRFLAGGTLGLIIYGLVSHTAFRPLPWFGLLFGSAVAAIGSALTGRRRRDRA
jgi:hypothetical protein